MFEAIIKRGTLMTVIILIISVIGIMASLRIPVQMIPDLDVRTVTVRTSWPGATPKDVEKEILIEQEEYLRTLPNLTRLEATASSGGASIELDFPFGVDMTQTLIEVNNALNQVPSYPENVDEPRVFEIGGAERASYGDLMREYARQRGLRRWMIRVSEIMKPIWWSCCWRG